MLVNFSTVLLALSAVAAVVALPVAEPDPDNHAPDLEGRKRAPIIVDGRTRHPRLQSKYSPVYDVCPGSIIDSGDWMDFSWYLYYSPANGGTNCAMVRNRSGRKRHMWVGVRGMSDGAWGSDYGQFLQYAGPAKATGTNNKCMMVDISVDYEPLEWTSELVLKNMACG